MEIIKHEEGEQLVMELKGRLDTNTASQLEEEVEKSVDGSVKTLVFDFKELEYISSAGLRVMLATQKKATALSAEMSVKNANDSIMEVFEMTGFLDVLKVEK
jgi:anti-sigma B factor antagonist